MIKINQFIKQDIVLFSVGIFMANLIFKSLFLSNYSYWYDEIYSVYYSLKDYEAIRNYATWGINPPFFQYVLHFWMKLFGSSEIATRYLSLIMNAVAGGLLFYFTDKHFNRKTAFYTSILFFTSNILFYYAHETRSYSLDVLWVVISNMVFFELWNQPNWKKAVILGLINWAAIYTHYLFGAIVLIQFITVLMYFNKSKLSYFILSGVVILVMFNTWIMRMVDVLRHGGNPDLSTENSIGNLINTFIELLNGPIVTLTLLSLLIFGALHLLKYRKADFKITYVLLSGYGFIVLMFILNLKATVFIDRYLIFSLIGIFIYSAHYLSQIPLNNNLKTGFIMAIGLAGLYNIEYTITKPMNYKAAIDIIKENEDEKTLKLVQSKSMVETYAYYYNNYLFKNAKDLKIELSKLDVISVSDSSSLNHINLGGYKKVILSQTFQEYADPNHTVEDYLEQNDFSIIKEDTVRWVFIKTYVNKKYKKEERMLSEIINENPNFIIQQYMDKVRNTPEWMEQIKVKAQQKNISIDSMIYLDAVWYMNN